MAVPTTRAAFKAHCLRRLGSPAIRINVTDEQVDDRVDEALDQYYHFHMNGSDKTYLAHQLTAPEVASKSIALDDTVLGVTDVFDMGFSTSAASGGSLNFNVPYQVLMDEVFGANKMGGGGVSDYVVMRTSLETMQEFLVGKFPFRYSENDDVLYLDIAREKLIAGNYVIIEAYRIIDADSNPDVWADTWLQRYACALIKQNWADVMSKHAGVALPGGVTLRGPQLRMEALAEIEKLEDELQNTYSPILCDLTG